MLGSELMARLGALTSADPLRSSQDGENQVFPSMDCIRGDRACRIARCSAGRRTTDKRAPPDSNSLNMAQVKCPDVERADVLLM